VALAFAVVGVFGAKVDDQAAKRIRVPLKPTGADFNSVVARLTTVSRVPLGFETVRTAKPVGTGGSFRDGQPSLSHALDVTDLPVAEALVKITDLEVDGPVHRYEWTTDADVFHVRPVSFRNNRTVALNRPFTAVELHVSNVLDALYAVHRLFDSTYSTEARPPAHLPERLRSQYYSPISLSLRNTSGRAVLDAIIRAHGAISWTAEYSTVDGRYTGLKLSLLGFDNWTVSAVAR
jgi:hypothetical protein